MTTNSARTGTETRGFTLIEILVVIGIIAILAAIVIVAVNPSRQFGQANNATRTSDLNAILNAVSQNIADNKGTTNCSGITSTATHIGTASGNVDLAACLVPTYISAIPVDPKSGSSAADTGYTILKDSNGRITVSAPNTEIGDPVISLTR